MRNWLSRNLVVLSLVSLTQDAASELMYPLMPLFLTGVLAAPAIVLGVVEGAAELAAGISKYFAGKKSDAVGRKVFITSGYAMAALGKLLVTTSIVWPTVLFGRVIDRIGKGIRSAPRDAMITNSVSSEHYGKAYGFHRSADTFGAVIGPVIALIGLSLTNGDVRKVMWWALVPAVISVFLTLLIKEQKRTPVTTPAKITKTKLPKDYWQTVWPFVLIAMVNIPDTLLLLRIATLGASTTQVVLAYILFNLVYTFSAYPAGILADRLSPTKIYALGLTAFGITFISLGQLTAAGPVMYLVVAIYGFFPALTDGIGKAMVSHTVAKEFHGRAQGIFQSLTGGAILIAGLWAGAFWGTGPTAGSVPMSLAGVMALVGAVLLLVFRRNGRFPIKPELLAE